MKIVSQYISYTAGGFPATGDEACAFAGYTVAYYYIFRGEIDTQSVCVASRFDTNIIIIAIDVAVFNQNISGRVDVDTIRTGAVSSQVIINDQSVYGAVIGIKNLASPKACPHQGESFEGNVRTAFHENTPYTFAVVIYNPA